MKNILVGFDGSEESIRAAKTAAELAQRNGGTLTIVYAMPGLASFDVSSAAVVEYLRSIREEVEKKLRALQDQLSLPNWKVRGEVLDGQAPAKRIADYASETKADLVVVGSHGKGALSRLLIGSVADRLIHTCPVSVLVVR